MRAATFVVSLLASSLAPVATAKYTTKGRDIVDRKTGERVILRGFGLGGWLLPEGYMWGIRNLNRPRQFESAISDLIGTDKATEFWQLYRENFVTEDDIAAMKSWGVNSLRIPLLASMLQPRDRQPDSPPFRYEESGFRILDRLVDWCEKHDMGVIWDMHGAPGGQNAENISDSDGVARLWTQKNTYWPLCNDLWMKLVRRYKDRACIIGYDLLNEPLLRRYEGIDPSLLRAFYVQLTRQIRTVDKDGIIFIEGDDWAQEFGMLEPLDWDEHLVVAFHSYPPTSRTEDLSRWERLRKKYNIPLWHGETGERGPPFKVNRVSTEFLESANVGWSWWTHKKLDRMTQPWLCPKTAGFQKVLDFWKGEGKRPSREVATAALFEQARLTNSKQCVFIPEMVRSLNGLDPDKERPGAKLFPPRIVTPPASVSAEEGSAAEFLALVAGHQLTYTWYRDGHELNDSDSFRLRLSHLNLKDDGAQFTLKVSNKEGSTLSSGATLRVGPFTGPRILRTNAPPRIDGEFDEVWKSAKSLPVDHIVFERGARNQDPPADCRLLWDQSALYLFVKVFDEVGCNKAAIDYENDGVEVFLDCNNDKGDLYGGKEFQFRYLWHTDKTRVVQGMIHGQLQAAQADRAGGYNMEFALPWASLAVEPHDGQFLGIDVHVIDNDGQGRALKRAWHASRDDAYLSPANLGTMRLSNPN